MNGILGTLQLLQRSQLDDAASVLIEKAMQSSKTLLTIINDILDYSKIEANMLTLEATPLSIIEIAESVSSDLRESALQKRLKLNVIIDSNFADGWEGDNVRIRQILINLLSNAIKFTEQGSVLLWVSNNATQTAIVIEVEDTGIGMPKEVQQRIFSRFEQADTSTTRKFGGTGLGMSITASLVQLMQGSINIESEPGNGTKVRVTLPLPKADLARTQHYDANCPPPDLTHTSILVAEDNEINRLVLKTMLEPTNASVEFAENGVQAVAMFDAQRFDLVLMDIQMPEMDGMQAYTQIARQSPLVPVVALTANVMPEEVAHYLKLGFREHLGKPVDMNQLYQLLGRYVSHKNKKSI